MEFDLMQYCCREKYYNAMKKLAESALHNSPNDPVLKLQYCVSLILNEKIGEALRELEMIVDNQDVALAAILASIHAQNLCEVPDGETLITLENRLKLERKRANEMSLYHAANFFIQLYNHGKAQEFADQIFRLNPNSRKGHLIKGWLELNNGNMTKAVDYFRFVLTQDSMNLDASFGEVRALSLDDEAISRLNQLIVKYPQLTPPLIEKMRLLFRNRDWDQAMDTATRILTVDSVCVPALEFQIIYGICIRGEYDRCTNLIAELAVQFEQQEPNSVWPLNFASLLSRVCCAPVILRASSSLIDAARDVAAIVELARHRYLLGEYRAAAELYKSAVKLDDTAADALIGLCECRVRENGFVDATKQQVDFLLEIYDSQPFPRLLVLQAGFETVNSKKAEKLINRAIDLKLESISSYAFGYNYLKNLDPTFILDCIRKYPSSVQNEVNKINYLRRILDDIPGFIDAWILLASTYLTTDDFEKAEKTLQKILDLDGTNSYANLMLAQVFIHQKKFDEADSLLNMCLSQNLNILTNPLYHFLWGKINKTRKKFQDCIDSMQSALNNLTDTDRLKPLDLASLYIDLSVCHQMLRQPIEATNAIQKATHLLEGTAQEDQILMARVDLELWKNDANMALELLSSISASSPLYYEARMKMAEIHLKVNNDKKMYIDCFKNLCEEHPSQENLIRLAEAYFSIRDIPKAVETYEKAIEQKSSPKLSRKLAELYIKCHQYGKAMRCYRETGSEGALDLAQLLFRLEQWEMTESTLSVVPLLDKALLLSKVKEKVGDVTGAIGVLNEAYKKCSRSNDLLATQFCCQIAEYEASLHDYESAIRHYKIALSHCDGNTGDGAVIQIALSRMYMQINDWTSCQSICSSLLSKEPNNEMALLMSADISFRKGDFSSADSLFRKLLERNPVYWIALSRLIEVKRRLACLDESKAYLLKAENINPNDPGLSYCAGLFSWYKNDYQEAIKYFSYVKQDLEWGQQALCNMVEIYLTGYEDHETARILLEEIRPNSQEEETNRCLLGNFVLLATKDKQSVEKAMNELTLLASRDILRVGASLGLAIGNMFVKQPQRARNVLKIIAKTVWQFEEAEYLERCWLMLAEHYVGSGKHELANELLKKILTFNLGCSKAHEFSGLIAEKDQKYGDAGTHYMKAWSLNENDPNLAYRLATVFMKSKAYALAISTCQQLLKKHPDNVKIKKDIYDKALALLRT